MFSKLAQSNINAMF
ncbi:TPA: hypothetical protein OO152_004608 [Shigella dysenteriae]|nr:MULTISPECIES: hypothetical protein [Shigella]EHN8123333.1 hypothetical protein [Shigella dysenteriae]EKH0170715.1 hypothetical protein [Shigella dysenteriae]EKH9110309.1 hypothetical protein [Shigella dysenteriae]HCR5457192.1 hypothetical protein [Shigella dysenteriae]HCR5473493.1 hypothetical protein [Shigella dysenteriae]